MVIKNKTELIYIHFHVYMIVLVLSNLVIYILDQILHVSSTYVYQFYKYLV